MMNVLKRAQISISRHLRKTITLLLLVFILGTMIAGALFVEDAVASMEVNLRHNMRPVVSFKVDSDAVTHYYDTYGVWPVNPTLSPEKVRQIADLPYVNQVSYSLYAYIETDQLRQVDRLGITGDERGSSLLPIIGTSDTMPLPMREGLIELVDGHVFTATELTSLNHEVHPIMISRGLAEATNLLVGSSIDFDLNVFSPQLDVEDLASEKKLFASKTFVLEVIGIFDSVATLNESEPQIEIDWQYQMVIRELLQTVFTTNKTAEAFQVFQAENHAAAFEEQLELTGMNADDFPWYQTSAEIERMATAVMELSDVNEIEAFKEAVEPLLPELMEVEDLLNSFGNILASMDNLQEIANWILNVAIGSSMLIIGLLMVLFLRERRHEIGIYLALGANKSKIIFQCLIETLLPTFGGITLALFSGNVMSEVFSHQMLRRQLVASQYVHGMNFHFDPNHLFALGLTQEMPLDEVLEVFYVPINVATIGLFYVIGFGVIIFSTIGPVLYILASSPNKVLR
jgi:putative ABC transport system permease protein